MKYAALFRGINVGGKNIVKMDDLKQLFLNLELHNVKTYIQSGNVVFETDLEETYLQNAIRAAKGFLRPPFATGKPSTSYMIC